MKALANRWMGRFPSMPEALPRHSQPCHAGCKICISMRWPYVVVVRNLYLYRQYLHSQFLLSCQARRWVQPTITPQATTVKLTLKITRVKFWRSSNYRWTLKYEVLVPREDLSERQLTESYAHQPLILYTHYHPWLASLPIIFVLNSSHAQSKYNQIFHILTKLFLATLVALHFTPVSKSLSKSLSGQSFGLA